MSNKKSKQFFLALFGGLERLALLNLYFLRLFGIFRYSIFFIPSLVNSYSFQNKEKTESKQDTKNCLFRQIRAFNVTLDIKEQVKLHRDASIECTATTWSQSITGTHGSDPEYIVSALSMLLDDFLNDYYKANPKKQSY